MLRFARVGLLAFPFLLSCAKPQTPITERGCTAPPEVEAAWKTLDDVEACGYQLPCWQQEIEAAKRLRDRFPQELFAHRVLVEKVAWASSLSEFRPARERLKTEYGELSRLHPSNPAYPYLMARLERNQKNKRALLDQAISIDPNFAWAHESLAAMLASKADEKKSARAQLEVFARQCPARTENLLSLLSDLEDRAAWEAHASALRADIRAENGAVAELPVLWGLEFQFAEPTAYPVLREGVRQQVEILRKADRPPDRRRLAALAKGYELLAEEKGKRSVGDIWLSRFPCENETFDVWLERYQETHGKYPEGEGPERQRWLNAYLPVLEAQLTRCPAGLSAWQDYLSSLSLTEGVQAAVIELAANRVLFLVGDRVSGHVAEVFIEKQIRLDRADWLLDADRYQIERWRNWEATGVEPEDAGSLRWYYLLEVKRNQVLRVRLALARRDPAAAEPALKALAATVGEVEKAALTSKERKSLTSSQADLWYWRARVAAMEERNGEALAAYARSLEKSPDDSETRTAAREMFGKVHGSTDGYEVWQQAAEQVARTASEEVRTTVRRPFPGFSLKDISGRVWTEADLHGRAVLVNFWATWCGPCMGEMPHLQKLHEKTKGRSDIAIVTVSVDDNPGLIEPFLKRSKYTFPALVGGAGSIQKLAGGGIPLNYVVDPRGTIVEESRGFGGDGALWETKMQERLEAALVSR